jgi:hypothetical protein
MSNLSSRHLGKCLHPGNIAEFDRKCRSWQVRSRKSSRHPDRQNGEVLLASLDEAFIDKLAFALDPLGELTVAR